jgi:tripeptide aminopeptidase
MVGVTQSIVNPQDSSMGYPSLANDVRCWHRRRATVAKLTTIELLNEGVLAKLLRYVQVDTESDESQEGVPSTTGQWDLAAMLAEELNTLNLANVQVDEHAIVTACLPQHDAPTIGLLAHMDTSPSVSGKHVQPLVHPDYHGLIQLPTGHVLEAA